MYENVDSVCSEVKHLLDHISLLGGSVSGSRMRPCLLTSQTAPDLWSMTSSTPCLDWTPSGLLNCYCHNPFRTAQQNKAFVATFKSRGRVKYWDTSVSVSVLSGSWSDRIRRSSTLQVEGQQAPGLWAHPATVLRENWWKPQFDGPDQEFSVLVPLGRWSLVVGLYWLASF